MVRSSSPIRARAATPRAVACGEANDLDRNLEEVGLVLHEDGRPGEPPVDPQFEQRATEVVGRGGGQHRHLGGQALEGGPDHVGR